MVGGTEVERTHGSLRSRCVMYGLISGFEMANYVTRLALGPLVAFIVRDGLFTEAQRALMLNSFTPGYVLTQIPAGWLIQRVGCKPVILMNSVGIVSIMLLLPLAARRGASAVSMCLFSFGVLQSSFAPALWTIKASWIPQGPERAWALMASGMGKCWPPSGDAWLAFQALSWWIAGTTLAKNIAAYATPRIAGSHGWEAATGSYALAVGLYAVLWQLRGRERPPPPPPPLPPPPPPPTTTTPPPTTTSTPTTTPSRGRAPFSPVQLLLAAPTFWNTWLHAQHDLAELQILAYWAPTYYSQVLGVELAKVGSYTFLPMLVALPAKPLVAAWETWMHRRGSSLRRTRQAAALIACGVSVPGGLLFAAARQPVLATVGYCIFIFGQVFDAAVVAPNKLDLGGTDGDMPTIASWSSTAAWTSGLCSATALVWLKQITGSWLPLLLAPLGLRVIGTWGYVRHCTMRPVREYLQVPRSRRRQYLHAQDEAPAAHREAGKQGQKAH
jgi:hypothetical protein